MISGTSNIRKKAMARITRTNPKTISRPFSNDAHVVTVEGAKKLVFCAGQVAADTNGRVLLADDFAAQTKMVMKNLTSALAAAGAPSFQSTPLVRATLLAAATKAVMAGLVAFACAAKAIEYRAKSNTATIESAERTRQLALTHPRSIYFTPFAQCAREQQSA